MGRGRISMELVQNDKRRQATFKKRKDGLLKKLNEFRTLCDVKACAIIYGPNSAEPEILPEKEEAHPIIQKYHNTTNDRRPKMYGLQEYFDDRIKKVEGEISKLGKNKMKMVYPDWHDSFNTYGEEQLKNLVNFLDGKLDACNERMNMLKGKEIAESSNPPYLAPNQSSNYLNYLMMQNMNSVGDSYNPFQLGESSQPASMLQLMGKDHAVTGDDTRSAENNQIQNMPSCYYDGNYVQTMQQQHALALANDLSSQNLQHQVAYPTLPDPYYDQFYQPNGYYDTDMQLQAQIFNYMHGRK